MYFDPLYLIIAIPGFLFALYASFITKSTFEKFSRVASTSGMTGARAAATLLRAAGINNVKIERVDGFLSDHYDPSSKTLRLSNNVYSSNSLSAIGVACHEAGHAIQHAVNYAPLSLRSAMVPFTQICSPLSYFIIFFGFILGSSHFVLFGVILFSAVVLFTLVTLPVEWNASARAKQLMVSCGIVSERERESASQVLNAAFMTYVASAVSALLTLLYYLIRSGILGGRRD